MAEGQDQMVHYHLARTVVSIIGVVTQKTRDDGVQTREHVADISVSAEADPASDFRLVFPKTGILRKDLDFDISLAPDEHLSAAGVTTTGVGAEVLEAGVKVISFVAPIVANMVSSTAKAEGPAAWEMVVPTPTPAPPAPKSVDEIFEDECPALAARRRSLRKAIEDLQTTFATKAKVFADNPAANDNGLKALEDALAGVRCEAGMLEAQFENWRASRFPPWVQKLTYTFGVEELPVLPTAAENLDLSAAGLSGDLKETMDKLGIVVVLVGSPQAPAARAQTGDPNATDKIQFRRPRPARLAVYEAAEPLPTGLFRLRSLVSAQIIDSHSALGDISFRSSQFAKHGTAAEFGDTGTLTRLSNKDVGALGILLGGAGGQVSQTSQASPAAATKPAVPTRVAPDLEALQGEVARRELEVRLIKADRKVARKDFEAPTAEADKKGDGVGK